MNSRQIENTNMHPIFHWITAYSIINFFCQVIGTQRNQDFEFMLTNNGLIYKNVGDVTFGPGATNKRTKWLWTMGLREVIINKRTKWLWTMRAKKVIINKRTQWLWTIGVSQVIIKMYVWVTTLIIKHT